MKEILSAESLASGDEKAWTELYGYPHKLFVNVLRHLGIPFDEIEDVIQEGLLKAHKGIKQLKPGENPIPWITTVIKNTGYDYQRLKRRRIQPISLDVVMNHEGREISSDARSDLIDPSPTPEDLVVTDDETEEILEKIKPEYRILFVLRSEGMSVKETASTTGLTEGSVKQHTFRERRRLSSLYERIN